MITLPFPCLCEICHEENGAGFNHDGFWVCDSCQPEASHTGDDGMKPRNTRRIFPKATPVVRSAVARERRPVIRNVQPTGVQAEADEIMHHDHDGRRERTDAGSQKKRGQQPAKATRGTKPKHHQATGKAKP